jgi:PAS domain S-box-containing protein
MRKGERVVIEDVAGSPLFAGVPALGVMLAAGARAVQSTPLFSRSGQLLGMFSTHYTRPTRPSEQELQQLDILARLAADSIDRIRTEQKLRDAEKRYRELFEALPAAVYTTDEAGRLTSFNQAAVEFSGRVPEVGSDSWCVSWKLHWPDGTPLPHDQCPMAMALKEGQPVRGYEAVAERPDGTRRNFIPFPTPLYDESGKLTGGVNMLVDITDRKQAENALRESEEMLRAIFNSSAVGVAVLTMDARFVEVNNAFCAITGYSEAELLQLDCVELSHPDDRAPMREQIAQLLAGDIQTFVIEKRYFRKNGAMIWAQNSVSLTRDAHKRPANIIVLCQDITERKFSEEALRASKAQLAAELADTRLLQEISAHLIEPGDEQELYEKIVEGARTIMRSDVATMQMFHPERGARGELRLLASHGLDDEGKKFWEWVRFNTGSTCGQALRTGNRAIAPDVGSCEFLAGTSGGEALLGAGIHSAQSTPLYSRSGSLVGMISSHWNRPHTPTERDLRLLDILARQGADLIERRRAERTRAQLSAIVESSGDAIYIYDFEGRILTWNAAAEELYGYSAGEMVGRSVEDLVPPEQRAELREIVNPGGSANRIVRNLETRRMKHDGSVFSAVLTVSPVRDGGGKAVALSVIARDITARKEAEDELRRANHDLEQFAYSASHDLQEPLRSIKIYGELLSRRYAGRLDGEALEFLEFLSAGATRMEHLVRDLLAYTQVTRLAAPDEPADASRALEASLQDLAAAVTSSGAEVIADPLPRVRMHETHIKQVFQNLIGNAIKYRDPGRSPAIRIGAETRNGACVFRVQDNGIGIEPEYKEQIFGLFTRLHTADQYSGTGIGLAICQRIVERYGGRIWVESEPGAGSTFRFSVPAGGG